jgi:hypothetical protein
LTAADFEVGGDVGQLVAIEEPQVDHRGHRSEVGENRALVDAVSAPRAREHEHRHLPDEAGENRPLCGREHDLGMESVPPVSLLGRAPRGEKVGVGQGCFEGRRPGLRGRRRACASNGTGRG